MIDINTEKNHDPPLKLTNCKIVEVAASGTESATKAVTPGCIKHSFHNVYRTQTRTTSTFTAAGVP